MSKISFSYLICLVYCFIFTNRHGGAWMGMLMGHTRRNGVADFCFRAACPRSLTDLLTSTFLILSACFEALLLFLRGTPVISAFCLFCH
ncbi:uncharacterized protein K452DRAFT_137238 [Aplosporella prunicola CBS 121167]|uniref:Uncharacterized protein n=1 Tax=Aplosporella prunicola CBS 121167 TaxID=1176127 RepID=A0A6A6BPW0_9PEZI|nr:uncharacterized protein K452DRAFT_137238 [Aplosporella prunicola CBS 121167]KAF2145264.1 hypothetical protein K452DRAFT_137238 [Aplosporella prunicola CBS 121167]